MRSIKAYAEEFEERSCILEYNNHCSKDEADLKAKEMTLESYKQDGGKDVERLTFAIRTIMFRKIK